MFIKGQSANPDGRKVEALVKRAARDEGVNCVRVLATVRDDETAPPEVRAEAAIKLLDLGKWHGRRREQGHLLMPASSMA